MSTSFSSGCVAANGGRRTRARDQDRGPGPRTRDSDHGPGTTDHRAPRAAARRATHRSASGPGRPPARRTAVARSGRRRPLHRRSRRTDPTRRPHPSRRPRPRSPPEPPQRTAKTHPSRRPPPGGPPRGPQSRRPYTWQTPRPRRHRKTTQPHPGRAAPPPPPGRRRRTPPTEPAHSPGAGARIGDRCGHRHHPRPSHRPLPHAQGSARPRPCRSLAGFLTTSPHLTPPPHPATRRKPHDHRPYRRCGPGRIPSTLVRVATAPRRARPPGGEFRIARSHERPAPLLRTVHATSHLNAPSPGATDATRKWPRPPLPRASTPAHRAVVADHGASPQRSPSAAPGGRTRWCLAPGRPELDAPPPDHGIPITASVTKKPQVSDARADTAQIPVARGRRPLPRERPLPGPCGPPPDATPGDGKCWSAGWRGVRAITHRRETATHFVEVEAESVLHLSSDVMTVSI